MINDATHAELYALFKAEYLARGGGDDFNAFSEQDAQAGATGAVGIASQNYAKDQFRKVRVGGAEGDELDDLALDSWRLTRIPASAAVGQLLLARATVAAGDETIASGAEFETGPDAQGTTKRVRATATYIMTSTSLTISVEATETGPGGNSEPGTFDTAASSPARKVVAFVDASITFSQPEAISGGAAEESDDDFRDRIRDYIRNRQRATVAAVLLGARFVGGVATVSIVEGVGYYTLYIGDAEGTSSQPLRDAVLTEQENWRAAGVAVTVTGVTRVHINASSTVNVSFVFSDSATNLDSLASAAFALMTQYTNELPAGSTWYRNMCEGAGREADKDAILNVSIGSSVPSTITEGADQVPYMPVADWRRV